MGFILLEGGAEFGGRMSEPDLQAIRLAGGLEAPIAILPTAAAPDHNHTRAGRNGLRWFKSLGASQVEPVPIIDKSSANDPALAARLRTARLIYLLGGFPRYLGETLHGSLAWQAALEAYQDGAVLGGSSAGAMVLCEKYYDPYEDRILPGLDLISNICLLPHHNNSGKGWASKLAHLLPRAALIGVDEQTGIINDGPQDGWTVYGAGTVTLYRKEQMEIHMHGDVFKL